MEDFNMNLESGIQADILRYAGISAELLTEENPEKIEKLEKEQKEIESHLGLNKEEIIVEARKLLIK